MRPEIQNSRDAVFDSGWEGVCRREAVVDADNYAFSALHDLSSPAGIIGCVAYRITAAMEVDKDREFIWRFGTVGFGGVKEEFEGAGDEADRGSDTTSEGYALREWGREIEIAVSADSLEEANNEDFDVEADA